MIGKKETLMGGLNWACKADTTIRTRGPGEERADRAKTQRRGGGAHVMKDPGTFSIAPHQKEQLPQRKDH